MAAKQDFDISLKLLLIGDSAVGKTCMLLRFSDDVFSQEMVATIGVDYKTKYIQLDGQTVKLQVWDTAGQERFRNITTAYYRGAKGIFLVYDVTNELSFKHVKTWMEKIQQLADESVSVMLVGNKCDSAKRVITSERGEELSEKYNVKFIETSALNNTNITKAFTQLAKEAKRNVGDSTKKTSQSSPTVKIEGGKPGQQPQPESCC
eukprot:CAMPEP_0117045230 /NCGR_PEP_ID=MMETSP0472-20121206/31290_1 /TAXON_ID=693140 ORGANISM="Tiarina fusus, Strain LIS" /NCGR_SAMPLE_ID=MMETSP0472 /ASSEMBLY_ACC=CAM_ASM_000603 /LENGTH=205 /DNA_ID=CAMNT_0004757151 /DNA_START=27 /DNA_END=644 /DNA_ORIENTATION=-